MHLDQVYGKHCAGSPFSPISLCSPWASDFLSLYQAHWLEQRIEWWQQDLVWSPSRELKKLSRASSWTIDEHKSECTDTQLFLKRVCWQLGLREVDWLAWNWFASYSHVDAHTLVLGRHLCPAGWHRFMPPFQFDVEIQMWSYSWSCNSSKTESRNWDMGKQTDSYRWNMEWRLGLKSYFILANEDPLHRR